MEYYILDYNNKPIGESGEDKENCNNIYTLSSACKKCGSGAILTGSLRTKGLSRVTKDFFSTLDGDYIISEKLLNSMKEKGIKVGNLLRIVDFRNKELPFYHFKTDDCFPKAREIKGLKKNRQCQTCKRNGYFTDAVIGNLKQNTPTIIPPLILVYEDIDSNLMSQSDIFNTWELLGLSNLKKEGNKIIRFARPMLIVSERLKKFFQDEGILDLKYEIVIIK